MQTFTDWGIASYETHIPEKKSGTKFRSRKVYFVMSGKLEGHKRSWLVD